jgi:hypothetical protein
VWLLDVVLVVFTYSGNLLLRQPTYGALLYWLLARFKNSERLSRRITNSDFRDPVS